MSTQTTAYDTVPYSGHALAQAHPNRLATIATLYGMKPADVGRSRVLELGCGDGLNLTSVALSLPEAECTGIDLAAAGIRRGQDRARQPWPQEYRAPATRHSERRRGSGALRFYHRARNLLMGPGDGAR